MDKILWATTFRGFSGTKNDELQLKFLKSLADSEDIEIQLVLSQWGEPRVEEHVRHFFPNAIIFNHPKEKWSLSQLVLDSSEILPGHDLIWSTCDIEFSSKLALVFSKTMQRDSCLVSSFPNYAVIQGEHSIPISGIDIFGIPAASRRGFENYTAENWNKGWGLFEHQMVSYFRSFETRSKRPINLETKARVFKNLNDRQELGEPSSRLKQEWKENLERWKWLGQKVSRKRFLSQAYIKMLFRGSRSGLMANLVVQLSRDAASLVNRWISKTR